MNDYLRTGFSHDSFILQNNSANCGERLKRTPDGELQSAIRRMLKKRFNVLRQENRRKLEHVVEDIAACFVLYNYGLKNDDPNEFSKLEDQRGRVVLWFYHFLTLARHNDIES